MIMMSKSEPEFDGIYSIGSSFVYFSFQLEIRPGFSPGNIQVGNGIFLNILEIIG
jgi:hypothetical protein